MRGVQRNVDGGVRRPSTVVAGPGPRLPLPPPPVCPPDADAADRKGDGAARSGWPRWPSGPRERVWERQGLVPLHLTDAPEPRNLHSTSSQAPPSAHPFPTPQHTPVTEKFPMTPSHADSVLQLALGAERESLGEKGEETRPGLGPLHLAAVKESLEGSGTEIFEVVLPDGEEYKTMDVLMTVPALSTYSVNKTKLHHDHLLEEQLEVSSDNMV